MSMHSCAVCVTIFSIHSTFQPVSNFIELHTYSSRPFLCAHVIRYTAFGIAYIVHLCHPYIESVPTLLYIWVPYIKSFKRHCCASCWFTHTLSHVPFVQHEQLKGSEVTRASSWEPIKPGTMGKKIYIDNQIRNTLECMNISGIQLNISNRNYRIKDSI